MYNSLPYSTEGTLWVIHLDNAQRLSTVLLWFVVLRLDRENEQEDVMIIPNRN